MNKTIASLKKVLSIIEFVRISLAIPMKRYSILPRAPEQEPHHQIQFNVIPSTPTFGGRGGSYPCVFYISKDKSFGDFFSHFEVWKFMENFVQLIMLYCNMASR